MRIFKIKWFSRFAAKEGITDEELKAVVEDLDQGRFDANLGGGVYKQRIARQGGGKAGGFRTIVLFRKGERSFFVYGFAKSDRDNIEDWELKQYRETAHDDFALTDEQLETYLKKGLFIEII